MAIRNSLGAAALVALLAAGAADAAPRHFTGYRYVTLTRVSLDEARATALKARPGKITDQELEPERGGTGLRYSFDIRSVDGVYEVGVDARTGAVLENGKEDASAD